MPRKKKQAPPPVQPGAHYTDPEINEFYGRNQDGSLVPKWDPETDQGDPPEPAPDPDKVARLAEEEMVFIEKPMVLEYFKQNINDLFLNDRAPMWAVVTVDVFFCTATLGLAGHRSAIDVLDLVRQDRDLQMAVSAAYRVKAAAFEVLDTILTWKKETDE